jgi:hypothetical protein
MFIWIVWLRWWPKGLSLVIPEARQFLRWRIQGSGLWLTGVQAAVLEKWWQGYGLPIVDVGMADLLLLLSLPVIKSVPAAATGAADESRHQIKNRRSTKIAVWLDF